MSETESESTASKPEVAKAKGINFAQTIKSVYGEEMKDEKDKAITLATVCINALTGLIEKDKTEEGRDKLRRFKLASKIAAAEKALQPIELSAEKITLLKSRVSTLYGAAGLVGSVWIMLDPSSEDE